MYAIYLKGTHTHVAMEGEEMKVRQGEGKRGEREKIRDLGSRVASS